MVKIILFKCCASWQYWQPFSFSSETISEEKDKHCPKDQRAYCNLPILWRVFSVVCLYPEYIYTFKVSVILIKPMFSPSRTWQCTTLWAPTMRTRTTSSTTRCARAWSRPATMCTWSQTAGSRWSRRSTPFGRLESECCCFNLVWW